MRWRAAMQGASIAAACVAYAAASYLAAKSPRPTLAGAALAYVPLLLAGAWMSWKSPRRALALSLVLLAVLALWLGRDALLLHYRWGYLVQSAGPMVLLALVFGSSLGRGRVALITRLALMAHQDCITPRTARYTRAVTWAWTLFFTLMALASATLFLAAPPAIWALFANALTAPLTLAMFIVEYGVRVLALPAHERTGPLQAVAAFMRYRQHATEHAAHGAGAGDTPVAGHQTGTMAPGPISAR